MATLREIRNAIAADMRADGMDVQSVLSYRESFKSAVRCTDEQRLLYTRKERVSVVTRLPMSFRK